MTQLKELNQDKLAVRTRLKIACINSGISQIQFVEKYYGNGIPKRDSGIPGAYSHMQNMLNPNQRQRVQDWLIACIEKEESAGGA